MKAAKVISPRNLEICDVPVPKITNENEVLIRVKAAGICGSDIHIYHGTSPVATYPRVIGHEVVGEVVEVGTKVTKVCVEDHVIMDPVVGCGECYPCSIGRPNVCSYLKVRGVHVDGGYQEYIVLPESGVHKISKELSWEEAILIEPFTIAAQIASRGEITKRDTVFIMGAGPAGLCAAQVIKRIGAKCIISDLVDARLELAQKMGVDMTINPSKQDVDKVIMDETNGLGVPVIIDAVCIPQTFEQAVKLAASAGRVILLGFTDTPSQIAQLEITKKELDVKGSRLHSNKFPEVIEWFNKKEIDPKILISNVYNFSDIMKAIEQVENNPIETYKVILKFD
ncbi:zinc-binding alcohol dehydrogenase family protein [Clostridium formicaceticum]|uniref:Alcohol dehydrogenase n=1 Tax=Clostridium formicaceticum TaxID=1497 RepID=A0AAC9RGJ3_9CLOT|nr:zinc-binding alcohol dehydrogenase family protein [Clostridium formicaceticum]AOY76087.1 alcohol dehydrogenase [Clostridium formicaceticum]ARE86449.1 putative zinc-type alcohol dehydrogenase-like protein YjmD [Clostridium formicaceticum]